MPRNNRYLRRKYRSILFRVVRGSELDARLAAQLDNGESVNYLITRLLCEHYGGCDCGQRRFIRRKTEAIL